MKIFPCITPWCSSKVKHQWGLCKSCWGCGRKRYARLRSHYYRKAKKERCSDCVYGDFCETEGYCVKLMEKSTDYYFRNANYSISSQFGCGGRERETAYALLGITVEGEEWDHVNLL